MRTNFVPLVALLVILPGCSSLTVNQDFDPEADFASYRTFAWIDREQAPATDANMASNTSGLVAKRVERAVISQLKGKGMTQAENNPDVLVTYYTGTKETINVSGSGYTYGSYFGGYGWGYRDTDVMQVTWGNLIIDIVDAKKKELVWRGTAQKAIDENPTPEQIDRTINEAVAKIFQQYPPQ